MNRVRKTRVGDFIDRHATILTILAMAALVLIPTKIAYDASGNATDAGNQAQHAARKARHAVVRLEDERRARIYDQNGIDRYFCGKSVAIEKVLTLLLTASLAIPPDHELTDAQQNARSVFERVLAELSEAPKCEVLIPAPPRPKPGESRAEAHHAEANAENHPSETRQFEETEEAEEAGPTIHVPPPIKAPSHQQEGSGGTHGGSGGGHEHQAEEPPTPDGEGPAPTAAAPPTESATGSTTPATPTTPPEAAAPEPTPTGKGLVPAVVESVEGVAGCLSKVDLACTLHEVTGP